MSASDQAVDPPQLEPLLLTNLYTARPPTIGHDNRIFNLQFHPASSSILATASDDNTVGIWKRSESTFRQVAAYQGHTDSVMRVSWHPSDHSLAASGSSDTTVHLWRVCASEDLFSNHNNKASRSVGHAGCRHVATLKGHPEEVYAVEWLETNTLAVASECSLFLWDVETEAVRHKIETPQPEVSASSSSMPERWKQGYIFGLAQQPAGSLLGAACSDGVLRFWNKSENNKAIQPHAASNWTDSVASDCAFSSDGALFAATAKDGMLLVLDMRQGGCLIHQQLPASIYSCRIARICDRDVIISAAGDGRVYCIDIATGAVSVLQPARYYGTVLHSVAASHDGSCIAAVGEAHKLSEWDIEGIPLGDGGEKDAAVGQVTTPQQQRKWSPVQIWDANSI